jgi:arylsulfatase A-like enzyme/Flp pilus assembly protein TadD
MSLIRHWFCILCLAASGLAGTTAPPNVILITLDTTRADRMGFLGSKRGITPNLDALARQSVVFTRAYSQVPLTTASHATILTGTYPQFHQVNDFGVPLAADLPYAPDIFHSNGYHTAAFVGSLVLDPETRSAPGFERGFDTYDAGFHRRHVGEDRYQSIERRGGEVIGRALDWLTQHHDEPFFIWVHLYDAHDPYDPPEPYKTRYASAPYDGEIAYEDAAVGKFLDWLRFRGLYDNAVIAVMADHGEALGQHGESTHGIFLYDETIHVPLIIKLPGDHLPGKLQAGKRIDSRVRLVDVLPTILQVAGLEVPRQVQGQSLFAMMKPNPAADRSEEAEASDRPAYAETDYPRRAYHWSSLQAWRTGKYLYIKAPRQELYDQSRDPQAEHDLAQGATAVADTLSAQLDAFRQQTRTTQDAPKVLTDPEAQEKLAALGYVATASSDTQPEANEGAVDPKDKIQIVALTDRATSLVDEGRFEEAIPLLQQLIALQPEAPVPYEQLGKCLILTKDFPRAVTMLRKILVSHPGLTDQHFQLAMALLATEDYAAAESELQIVVDRRPRWDQPHLMLATAYAQTDRAREAVTECEEVLEFAPNNFAALLLEGQVLVDSNQPEAALPRLEAAATLEPRAAQPHLLLAAAYEQLGQKPDARRERAFARRLGTTPQR